MLLESIRDVEFGEALKSLARELEKVNSRQQYVTKFTNDEEMYHAVLRITDGGGHIDQVIKDLGQVEHSNHNHPCYSLVIYTADRPLV